MFTGIIETTARVRSISSSSFWLDVDFASTLKIGQSVACNGVCLTVVERDKKGFRIELLEETKKKSSFAGLKKKSLVNVERAMKIGDRFDGHVVMGHSEGVGRIVKIILEPGSEMTRLITVMIPKVLMKYMLLKGIVILDGIALTLTKVIAKKSQIEVAIIPHTWENTNLRSLQVGNKVNIETDVVGKWLEKFASEIAKS
jgi:riboflavin synthase